MNEAWKRIFKKYIAGYDAIETLAHIGILDEEEKADREHALLLNIIDTMKSEMED